MLFCRVRELQHWPHPILLLRCHRILHRCLHPVLRHVLLLGPAQDKPGEQTAAAITIAPLKQSLPADTFFAHTVQRIVSCIFFCSPDTSALQISVSLMCTCRQCDHIHTDEEVLWSIMSIMDVEHTCAVQFAPAAVGYPTAYATPVGPGYDASNIQAYGAAPVPYNAQQYGPAAAGVPAKM